MEDIGRSLACFVVGLGIGAATAVLLVPQSGEDTREWITNRANRQAKSLRRKGQASIESLQDAVDVSGEKIATILKSSKDVLSAVSAKLD